MSGLHFGLAESLYCMFLLRNKEKLSLNYCQQTSDIAADANVCNFLVIFIFHVFADDINGTNTLPRRGKNGDIGKRSVSDSDMNGRNTPPGTRVDVMYGLLILCTP